MKPPVPVLNATKHIEEGASSLKNVTRKEDSTIQRTIRKRQVSRRGFLRGAGALLAAAGSGSLLESCRVARTHSTSSSNAVAPSGTPTPRTPNPSELNYQSVQTAPNQPPTGIGRFFSSREAQTVDALTSRIIPGDASDPGAHEAGVVVFIDYMLASNDGGFGEPAYMQGPFAETYQGSLHPASPPNHAVIWVSKDQIDRYGFQSQLNMREIYRAGLKSLDAFSMSKFNQNFADLSTDQQDQIVGALEGGNASQFFDHPTDKNFFKLVREHTLEGMFSDPLYGGNQNYVGWKLIGYPGVQRAYTPTDIHNEDFYRPVEGMNDMMPFEPGVPVNPHVILPVSGSHETQP